jgi:hypothetical protein
MQDRASSKPKCTNYDDTDEDSPVVGGGDSDSVVSEMSANTKQTNASKKTTASSSTKKRKGHVLMDDGTVAALTKGNKVLQRKMIQIARHNKAVEDMDTKRFQLEEKCFKSMSWQGKNDELNYKMNLLSRYQESKKLNWTDEQIVGFCPDMQQVIAAQRMPPLTQESFNEEDNEGKEDAGGGFVYQGDSSYQNF